MNYTGYIPQYDNPELNTIDKLLRISGLIIAPFNLFLVTCLVLLTKSDGKRFHRNFCIIRFHMLVAFYLISVPPFPLYIVGLAQNTTTPNGFSAYIRTWCIIAINSGSDLLRYIWTAFAIERYYATVYSNVYEKTNFTYIPVLLTIFCYSTMGIVELLKYCFNSSEIIIYGIMSISDIVGLIAIQKLGKYNKELRKITLSSNVVLSQRYQICENIRALQLIYPIFIMGICLTTCGTVIRVLTTTINELKWIYRYAIVAYYDLFNLYVIVALVIWLRKDPIYCKKVRRLFRPTFQNRNSTITPTSTFQNKQLVIKDVEGKFVMTDQTIEVYFSSLNQIWNNPNMRPKSPT